MARLFDDGSNEYLQVENAVVLGEPFSMAAWFFCDDAANNGTIIAIQDKDVPDQRFIMRVQGDQGGDPIGLLSQAGGLSNATTTTGYSVNTWHHALSVIAASDDRAI